jgi:hypothetical protein
MRDFSLNKEASENLPACEQTGIEVVQTGCLVPDLFVRKRK